MAEQTAEGRYQQKPFLLKEKIADMHKYGKRAVDQFPRREKQTADEIRASMLRMFVLSISVEKSYGSEKRKSLEALDRENAVLRHLIRLSSDKDYYNSNIAPPLAFRKYEYWARLLDEIGRIIGGYMKSQR